MILLMCDYHNIHVKKVPQKLKTQTAINMTSSLLDIHISIAAVIKAAPLHHPVPVTIEGQGRVCHGGIASEVWSKAQ